MSRTLKASLALGLTLGLCACFDDSHPTASADPEQTVTVIASAEAKGPELPRFVLLADGWKVGEAEVAATHAGDSWGSYTFTLPAAGSKKLSVRYLNDAADRDLWIKEVVVGGTDILKPEQATYLRQNREPMQGRSRMSWPGELQFELPAAG